MASLLTAKPINVQVKYRSLFAPPRYNLYTAEVGTALALKIAEIYGLKSTGVVVNHNAASTQYLSFRYFYQGEPFRHMDVFIGLDQSEIIFSNPATISELTNEVGKAFAIIMEALTPIVNGTYVEATLHCETERPGAQAFFNEMLRASAPGPELPKGFSFGTQRGYDSAKLNLEVSDSVPDGLYVGFAFFSKAILRDIASFSDFFDTVLATYRKLQDSASIHIVESK